MEKEHAPKDIAGSKVLQCEYTGEARNIRVMSGSGTGASAVFQGRRMSSPKMSSAAPATMTPPRTKVARETNIGNRYKNSMPRIEVGMQGEFYFEAKWYRVEIVDSSVPSSATTTSQSEGEQLFVVNYINSRGRRGKDHTENVSIEWLRGLVCCKRGCSSRNSSSPPRVYVGMLSKCRTEQSGPEHIFAPYESGYVSRVLPDDRIQFKFINSKHASAIAKISDLLFLSGPSLEGSAVTECEHADDQALTTIESRTDSGSEDDGAHLGSDTTDVDAFVLDAEAEDTKRPAKSVVAKKSECPSPPVDAATESHVPDKKKARQDRHNTASIELDGNPICSICREDFSTDQSSFDDVRESKLPVSSMQCSHRVCCECLTRWQALEISKYRVVKKDRPKPKWMACPECKRSTAFNAVDMKVDTLLCGCLNMISSQDAKILNQEAEISRLKSEIESMQKTHNGSRQEKIVVEI